MEERPKDRPFSRDSGYDTWNMPRVTHVFSRAAESGRAKVKELLARHSELEQSENKAQAALVTVLALTQITELKLLLDLGSKGHRFYEFVFTMLIACICLELFIGVIIIYIGNLHYYEHHSSLWNDVDARPSCWYRFLYCLTCCCRCCVRRFKRRGPYRSVTDTSISAGQPKRIGPAGKAPMAETRFTDDPDAGCCGSGWANWSIEVMEARTGVGLTLEAADERMESARIRAADAEFKIVRVSNYLRVLEDALRKAPGNVELTEELNKAQDGLSAATRLKQEADRDMTEAEVQQTRACLERERLEERQERLTFRKLSQWQHAATYLLYFVMLMNVFITTFGISGSEHTVFGLSPSTRSRNTTTAY